MKHKSKILIILFAVTLLTGCISFDKDAITDDSFKKTMEEIGLTVIDETESGDDQYQSIYVATDEEKYSFEYYFMRNESSAEAVYDYFRDNLEETYSSDETAVIIEDSKETQAEYSVSASDYYCKVTRIDNSVLYMVSYIDYKDEAKDILDDLGY